MKRMLGMNLTADEVAALEARATAEGDLEVGAGREMVSLGGATPFTNLVDREWDNLLGKDDRTSPAEYPDMCLITRRELACAMTEAFVFAKTSEGRTGGE